MVIRRLNHVYPTIPQGPRYRLIALFFLSISRFPPFVLPACELSVRAISRMQRSTCYQFLPILADYVHSVPHKSRIPSSTKRTRMRCTRGTTRGTGKAEVVQHALHKQGHHIRVRGWSFSLLRHGDNQHQQAPMDCWSKLNLEFNPLDDPEVIFDRFKLQLDVAFFMEIIILRC
ncbi:hypothetical protein U9M48_012351 [Paspalum notatum var. saurae]|uniref:Uncharacterized protein n=1 Tax=Paspalum notatum var. saurae TaxID=547442 RepID=A0AAQ3SXP6_PASNO